MTHVLLLNLVFFIPATCGATAFAVIVYRLLRVAPPPASPPDGGTKTPSPLAGPDDLARSA
ncbi:MAG TPA: hypothetical protein VKO84_09780 [Gaiellaceae bacterium]|nr:hypothetical protein [Gaiellaceae bacterium]